MIDETLLNSLSAKEKELFKQGLKDLIDQTYVIEDEYKKLGESYNALQEFIRQIIEVQPNALWVLDEQGTLFLENSEAKKIDAILEGLPRQDFTQEVEWQNRFYLLNSVMQGDKQIITATDITEGKRQERLVSMGQVAAHLSHEIRNPIGSVSLLASTLLKKVDPNVKPLVTEIKKLSGEWNVSSKQPCFLPKVCTSTPLLFTWINLSKSAKRQLSITRIRKKLRFILNFRISKSKATLSF